MQLWPKNEQLRADLLRAISHDLRTPLCSISGNADMLLGNSDRLDEATKHQIYSDIYDDSEWLIGVVENLLSITRLNDGRLKFKFTDQLLDEVIAESLRHISRKHDDYKIVTDCEELVLARMDVRLIIQVLVNLIDNAIKYTPPGGSVMVNLDELPCDEHGYMMVRTRISDTGIGMSEEYLTEIFEAFTREQNTTKSKIAGTGLGMSIVKKYVDLLGGTIEVESELGKGSTFTVTLKHKIADESYYVKKHLEESGISREILKDRSILLAEDNDLNAEIAAVILERAGLKVERVEDGLQCISRITEMPAGTYDIILMDIQMPKMDG